MERVELSGGRTAVITIDKNTEQVTISLPHGQLSPIDARTLGMELQRASWTAGAHRTARADKATTERVCAHSRQLMGVAVTALENRRQLLGAAVTALESRRQLMGVAATALENRRQLMGVAATALENHRQGDGG